MSHFDWPAGGVPEPPKYRYLRLWEYPFLLLIPPFKAYDFLWGKIMNARVHFTSLTDMWSTPQDFFDELDEEFRFTLDVCATPENAKCEHFFTKERDGLAQDWGANTCWMNPPYGRAIKDWMRKAYEASLDGATVVCLVPARTDTAWWWDYAMKGDIRFVRGRLKFGGSKDSAPFPSAVVIFWGQGDGFGWRFITKKSWDALRSVIK